MSYVNKTEECGGKKKFVPFFLLGLFINLPKNELPHQGLKTTQIFS